MQPQRDDDWITGAKAIAHEMQCSVRTVYRYAVNPNTPIYKAAGRYSARRAELLAWMRSKPPAAITDTLAGSA